MMRLTLTMLASTLAVIACAGPQGLVTSEAPTNEVLPSPSAVAATHPVESAQAGLPEGVLQVGSVAHPTPEEVEILGKCQVGGDLAIAPNQVTGMAKLSDGSEITHFIPLSGREPQLNDPEPVWLLTVHGDIPQFGGEVWVDPSCVVTRQTFGYFATGAIRNKETGAETTPLPPVSQPDRSLPPPAP